MANYGGRMNHYDHLMHHDDELFQNLCWIYYPILCGLRRERTRHRVVVDEFQAYREYNSDDWSFDRKDLPNVYGYVTFPQDYIVDRIDIEFRVKLPPMRFTKLCGRMTTRREGADEFIIADHHFLFEPESSTIPSDDGNPDFNWAPYNSDKEFKAALRKWKRETLEIDKVFFEWLSEVRYYATLTKVAL